MTGLLELVRRHHVAAGSIVFVVWLVLTLLLRPRRRPDLHRLGEAGGCRYSQRVGRSVVELMMQGSVEPEHLERFEASVAFAFRPRSLVFLPASTAARIVQINIAPPDGGEPFSFGAAVHEPPTKPAIVPGSSVVLWIKNSDACPVEWLVRIVGDRVE